MGSGEGVAGSPETGKKKLEGRERDEEEGDEEGKSRHERVAGAL